jgi:hypothetical protein
VVKRRHVLRLVLVVLATTAVPCAAQEAISRATTVYSLPDVPPDPVTEATSRAVTVYALPDVPPGPVTEAISRSFTVYSLPDIPPDAITEATSRSLTVYNLPDVPPDPVTEAISRAITIRADDLSAVPGEDLPRAFALTGASPNPFNPLTTIRFDVPRSARVQLKIFNVKGALVRVLLDDELVAAGRREAVWDGRDLRGRTVAAGVYLCRMSAAGYIGTVGVTLVK